MPDSRISTCRMLSIATVMENGRNSAQKNWTTSLSVSDRQSEEVEPADFSRDMFIGRRKAGLGCELF